MAGFDHKYKTPLLDELEKGPWPSFVKELKRAAAKKPMAEGLLGQLEKSYRDKMGYWKHGGLVGIQGYGAGIIGRYSALGDDFPEIKAFHTVRINQPAGWFYSSKALRTLCDIWDKHGSGLLNVHGSTGDFVLLGTTSEQLEDCFTDYSNAGWDLGGSSSDMRTPSCCNGMARCEFAYLLNLPRQSRSHWSNTRLAPLHAWRAGNIHVERDRVFIHEIAAHAEGTRVHAESVTTFIENIGGDFGAANVTSRFARIELVE